MRLQPDRAEFHALAATHTVVPVWTELLADLETPVAAFVKLVGDGPGFLLESVEHGERWSRFSFVGRNPSATLILRGGVVEVHGDLPVEIPTDRGILAAIEALLAEFRSPSFPDLPPLHGGIMGYLGYDVIREVEHLPDVPHDDRELPDAIMGVIGSLAAFDHWRQRVSLIESVPTFGLGPDELDVAYDDASERVAAAVADLARPLPYVAVEPPQRDDVLPELRSSMPGGQYQRAVEVAKEHILDGDIFQVVLSQRYDLDLGADPFDLYRVLRQVNPSLYTYFVRHPEITVVGSSPEPMVQVLAGAADGGRSRVVSRPIAGTRRRGATDEHDRRMAAELIEHPKERAEHVMLVDLARNDVGRVAEFGSVHVDELMTLERYSHVMHMTSQVSGDLVDGLGPIDVLRATLPAGTVSGAPKVRAMEIIDALEPVKRGPYAGVVGYVDWSGNLDTAIAIRTMFVRGDGSAGPATASLQAGAGIVADSVPDDEDLECRNKAAGLLAAIPAARRMTAARRAAGTQA
ncbi:anthranilate synthase component I [soil metagenome]